MNNLSGIGDIDDYGMGAIDTPWGIFKADKKLAVRNLIDERIDLAITKVTSDRKQAIQNVKNLIAKERQAEIEATLASYRAEINKRLAEITETIASGQEEARLARIKIVTDRDLKAKALQDKILKGRADAMELAAIDAKKAREELIGMFNLKIKTVSTTIRDEQSAYQVKNEAALTKQKVDILAERELALKTAVSEAKMARDVILKDIQSNLKTQIDLIRVERREVVDSLKKEFTDAINAARTAREQLEARRMASMQEAKAEMLAAREKAISDLSAAVTIERNKLKAEAISYTNKTMNELKLLSEQLISNARSEAASGLSSLKTERQKALEAARLQLISEREAGLKAASEERGKIESSITVLEKERTARIKADAFVKSKRVEAMRKAVHPMEMLMKYWNKTLKAT